MRKLDKMANAKNTETESQKHKSLEDEFTQNLALL